MSFEEATRTRLVDHDQVGSIVGTRVYWRIRPKGSEPAIVLTIVSDPRPQHLEGFHSLRGTRIQIECYAATYDEARKLREAAIVAIAGKTVVGTERFDHAIINNVMDRGEDTAAGFVQCQLIDATIWHGTLE